MKFQLGEDPLLRTLGIPNGCIESDQHLVYSLRYGKKRIAKLLRLGTIDDDMSRELERDMIEARIMDSEDEVYAKIAQWEKPTGFEPSLTFQRCDCRNPLVHGPILWTRLHIPSQSHFSIFTLFAQAYTQVYRGKISIDDAAHLLKQVIDCGLAQNQRQLHQRFNTLDPQVRTTIGHPTFCEPKDPIKTVVKALEGGAIVQIADGIN